MNSWFHYAEKLYAATIRVHRLPWPSRYSWGAIGDALVQVLPRSSSWPSTSLIAVVSDFRERHPRLGLPPGCPPRSVTQIWRLAHNVFNGVAGIINIACMTGWFGIYISKSARICCGRT